MITIALQIQCTSAVRGREGIRMRRIHPLVTYQRSPRGSKSSNNSIRRGSSLNNARTAGWTGAKAPKDAARR